MDDNICTKENPYKNTIKGRWQHPNAEKIREYDLDYSTWVVYKCPNCSLEFTVEMPN